jgi:hypothetical protein
MGHPQKKIEAVKAAKSEVAEPIIDITAGSLLIQDHRI